MKLTPPPEPVAPDELIEDGVHWVAITEAQARYFAYWRGDPQVLTPDTKQIGGRWYKSMGWVGKP